MQRHWDWFRDAEGRGYPGAVVTVYNAGTSDKPQLYSASGSITSPAPISNPTSTDPYGYYAFAVPNGTYDIHLQGGGMPTTIIPNITIGTTDITAIDASDVTLTAYDFVSGGSVQSGVEEIVDEVNTKLTANSPIVGATKTKITYDADGLVTGGADATASEIVNVPAGGIAATNVQAAINELDTEKVTANVAITGATKTKITYDAKGLVTGGADATTADIADSTNKRYVTDAQSTVIGNTSGVNTGDQPLVTMSQTVMSGPTSSGLPSFLPATSVNLNLTTQSITALVPLIVTAANGYGSMGNVNLVGVATADITWTGLTANSTNYLFVKVNADGTISDPTFSVLPIVYQPAGTPATTANLHTYNWTERKMYVGNGSTAPAATRVCVGEAVTNASAVTSTVAYAYGGQWVDTNQSYPGTSSVLTRSHNVGAPVMDFSRIICVTTDRGYPAGSELLTSAVTDTGGAACCMAVSHDNKSISFSMSQNVPYLRPFAGGNVATMTAANWRVQGRVRRLFL